jgi:hypothetical protein
MRRRNVVSFEEAHVKEAHEKAVLDRRDGLHAAISAHAEALPMTIPTSTIAHPHAVLFRRIPNSVGNKVPGGVVNQLLRDLWRQAPCRGRRRPVGAADFFFCSSSQFS